MEEQVILTHVNGPIAQITVNRQSHLNALNRHTLEQIKNTLLEVKETKSIRGVMLLGSGNKAFIAGADIKEQNQLSSEEAKEFGKLGQDVTFLLETLPVPTVACVNGYALGGGCELAMSCDFIYATESAVFGQPEVNLGLIPGFGGCVRLIEAVGPGRAKEMIFTGRFVPASEALQIGLINKIFASKEEMMAAAEDTLRLIAEKAPLAISLCKQVLNNLPGQTRADQLASENAAFAKVYETEDSRIGMKAFMEKSKAEFIGM